MGSAAGTNVAAMGCPLKAVAQIADLASDAMAITSGGLFTGRRTRIRYVNRALLELFGCSSEAFLDKPPVTFFGSSIDQAMRQRIHRAQRAGRQVTLDFIMSGKDGSKTFRLSLFPANLAKGKPRNWIARFDLLSQYSGALWHAPQTVLGMASYSKILDEGINGLPVGLCLFDSNERLILCNQKYREMHKELDDVLVPGVSAEDLTRVAVERGIYSVSGKEGHKIIRERLDFLRNNGVFDCEFSDGRWVRNEDRRLSDGSIMGLRVDITELKQKESALRTQVSELQTSRRDLEDQRRRLADLADRLAAARNEAEKANRTKSDFLANVSHELRSPLNAIIGFAEIMKNQLFGTLADQYLEYAEDIYGSGIHLLAIINDILDLAKIEAGKMELRESHVNIAAVIESTVRLVQERADQGGVTLKCAIRWAPASVWADERKVKQIFLNILTNAVKFTAAGGQITIGIRRDERDQLVVSITDTGIGMSAADISHAMSLFGQVDSSLARKYEGTGLGLPLTKELVELHNGRLVIASAVGKGTKVQIYFPSERVQISPSDPMPKLPPPGQGAIPTHQQTG